MEVISYPSKPIVCRPDQAWLTRVIDYNPCFLLSAVCMLFGCRLLNAAINSHPGDVQGALGLIATINVYEFCLLGVAMFIRHWQGMRRDVSILLIVAMLFMGDLAFVIGDLSTVNVKIGLTVAAILTPLAALKTWLAMSIVGSSHRHRLASLVGAQIGLVLLLPVAMNAIATPHDGYLSPAAAYTGWWFASLLPIVWQFVLPGGSFRKLSPLALAYVIGPWVALLGHLWACAWVFKVDTPIACLSPVLLGLAMFFGMNRREERDDTAVGLQWTLTVMALFITLGSSDLLVGHPTYSWLAVSPFRFVLLAGVAVSVHGFVVHRRPLFIVLATVMAVLAMLGPNPSYIAWTIHDLVNRSGDVVDSWLPTTPKAWGIWTISTAFVLLIAGTAVSFVMKPPKRQEG